MKSFGSIAMVSILAGVCQLAQAAQPAGGKLVFDTYSGYFVSNQFEPKAAESWVVITSQQRFEKVFGVGMVMGDKSHRLAADAFDSQIVLAVIKRGNATWEYQVDSVTLDRGEVTVSFTATSTPNKNATFACPLILSIPKGAYKTVVFAEKGKPAKRVGIV